MARTSTVTADDEQVDLWSPITLDDLEENLGVFNMLDRRHEEAASGAGGYERIFIDGVGNYLTGAAAYTAGTTTLTYEAVVLNAPITLDVDTHVYHAFELEKETALRIKIPLMERAISKSTYALRLRIDDDAAALMDNAPTGATTVGVFAQGLDEEDVRTGARNLDNSIAPATGRKFIMSPSQYYHFLGQEVFRNQLYSSSLGKLTANDEVRGFHGRMYQADWFVSGNVEGSDSAGHDNAMFHTEMAAVAMQENLRVAKMYEIDDDADKYAVHAVYGLVSERGNHLVLMRGL